MRSHILLLSTRVPLSYSALPFSRNNLHSTPVRGSRVSRRASSSSRNPPDSSSTPSPADPAHPPKEPNSNGKNEPSISSTPALTVFEEVLNNACLSLQPQTQHRATLALYCPIEGGNYVIDETVRELARRTGSDVVVLDAVHVAAGEWGHFGQGVLCPPQPTLVLMTPTPRPSAVMHDEDDDDDPRMVFPSSPLEVQLAALVYIRDFSALSSAWESVHPALLSAVRQRRQGALSRSTSPVVNPTVIVFGITPPIFLPSSIPPSPPGPQGLMNMLTSRSVRLWEENHAEKAREWRLRERLRKWERGDHTLQSNSQRRVRSFGHPNVVSIGGPGGLGGAAPLFSFLGPFLGGGFRPGLQSAGSNSPTTSSGVLRTSILVPASRSLRREINELTMRMAVGAVGGLLETRSASSVFSELAASRPDEHSEHEPGDTTSAVKMWDEWGNKIEAWTTVKQIADQAVGRVVSSSLELVKLTLSPTPILWAHVCSSWGDQRVSRDLRKAWIQQISSRTTGEDQQDRDLDDDSHTHAGDIVEAVKTDPYLDTHEQRLLGCIVDSVSMPTSFAQVHLPAHTIDSVRTIVSLPLLHPTAFQEGILKEHSMTGCLLFGPPGTGKTLVVRALAKEAGCRMLAISPSDVMDMYVGEGEKLVRSVFSLARRLAPCVVFIDEIDALFGARSSSRDTAGGFVHRGVITEFMQEMDGLKTSNTDNVIVIGATNRPFDLDDAVLRRLPRRLLIDLPGENEREGGLETLARDTPTFSGSDLNVNLCVSAALDAVKENVSVPWVVEKNATATAIASQETLQLQPSDSDGDSAPHRRILRPHNFAKALKEITPSASESLGTLADLRRWNDEFGEGRKRKKQVWGKDRFGFTRQWNKGEDGRVATLTQGSDPSETSSVE
ncbi:hypothetical protein BGW80DRAFT_1434423 [Lactifluus volemus]|nr:hypothetical protein BGW80DRAFT_1434423 [Lactifluus volemus]